MTEPDVEEPLLSPGERAAINNGRWFSSLSPALRHDILRCMYVRRYRHGEQIAARGELPVSWMACARGAVRLSSTGGSGKEITLDYIEPGLWFGELSLIEGDTHTHDAWAQGDTVLLCVGKADFERVLAAHVELYAAMLRLQARRMRKLFEIVEDLNGLPLRSRLAKKILHLCRGHGVKEASPCGEMPGTRINLGLAQQELARLVGGARQRINLELKTMEREGVIEVESCGVVVRDALALQRISQAPGAIGLQPAASGTGRH
ncbi:MAG: Crp/Fnr family transcriptional regulator [Pseudomonadota bacterium]